MTDLDLIWLNPKKAVRCLNEICLDEINLGDFENRNPKKPLWALPTNRKILEIGKYALMRELPDTDRGMLRRLFDDDEKIGFLFVERGKIDIDGEENGGCYELAKLRLKRPLILSDGGILNPLTVKVYAEARGYGPLEFTRTDHVRRIGLWIRARASDTLPIDVFKKDLVRSYKSAS